MHDYGICRIQPPPSWKPPAAFHWRQSSADDGEASPDGGEEESGTSAGAPSTDAPEEDSEAASADAEEEGGAMPSVAKMPSLTAQRSAGATGIIDYKPVSDDDAFYARLQSVKQRRCSPLAAHPSPFICQFQANYEKYTGSQLRELDGAPSRCATPPQPPRGCRRSRPARHTHLSRRVLRHDPTTHRSAASPVYAPPVAPPGSRTDTTVTATTAAHPCLNPWLTPGLNLNALLTPSPLPPPSRSPPA